MLTSRWIGHGDAALDALDQEIVGARADNPLAPITVVTPTASVAVATRRALIRRRGALVGVGFHSLGAVAELIAGPELSRAGIDIGVDRELVVAAVRTVLARDPGRLAPIKHHRSTWEAIARTIGDLGSVEGDALDALGAHGEVPAEVRRIHDQVRELVGVNGPHAVLRLARDLVEAAVGTETPPTVSALGPVIVFLPDRLSGLEQQLVRGLGQLIDVTVLLGITGNRAADEGFAVALSALAVPAPPPTTGPVATEMLSANDVDDEVRTALRRLLHLADRGVPLHRMALVHPPGPPYARVVADVLRASGVPAAGPSTRTLAETVVGRVLARLLAVIRSDFERAAVIDLWSTGVIVDAGGDILPFAHLDHRSRVLGTPRGIDAWREVLDADDRWTERQMGEGSDAEAGRRHLATNAQLRNAVETLAELIAALPAQWEAVAGWVGNALDVLVGSRARRSWPDVEFTAEDALRTALGRLAALQSVEPEPPQALIVDTIETALTSPAPRETSSGTGLTVTTLEHPPLVPLDAVAVIGMVEGYAPRFGRDDVLLGDTLRSSLGLPTRDDTYDRSHRALHATLASARDIRILTFPRHDQRSGRAMVPSRWLIDAVEARTGYRPDAGDLIDGTPVADVEVVDSYQAGLADVRSGHTAALDGGERLLAELVTRPDIEAHPGIDPDLRAGIALIRARASHRFTRFDGDVGEGPDITGLGVLSPTSLETYATCPRRWFFAHELRLRPFDRPEEAEAITPLDRGRLVHKALERFFGEAIDAGTIPAPGVLWPPAARDRLRQIGEEECDHAERVVPTGHPRRWAHDRAAIAKILDATLDGDTELRAKYGVTPTSVEFTFGRNDRPPLRIDLGDGRVVALAGQADRVDIGPGRTVVWDYKVATSRRWGVLTKDEAKGGDPLGFGTKLQLVVYAMAATGLGHGNGEVRAAYWFLSTDPTDRNKVIGYSVTDELRDRFRDTLRVLADGIGSGHYPARPGSYQWHLGDFEHCAWCEFSEICPADRDEEWVRVRFEPALSDLRTLVEDGSAQLSSGAPGGEAR